jgi:methylaspartate ammonia-lyase
LKIVDVRATSGRTGFFFDDLGAIGKAAVRDGATYKGKPITEGFTGIRQVGESILVMLILEDGQIALGDSAAVQYSGASGREPLFLAETYLPVFNKHVVPHLKGKELTSFRDLASSVDSFINPDTGRRLHSALRYGITQAILDAVAKSQKKLMCQVIAEEYGTTLTQRPIPIFTQSGDNRYDNVDKMILKMVDVLPHGLVNNLQVLGDGGSQLSKYISWLKNRILAIHPQSSYQPILHFDVYGTIGALFNNNPDRMVAYFQQLEEAADPLEVRIEGPADRGNRQDQMELFRELTEKIEARGLRLKIVADEWCNTLEDVKFFADNRAGHILQIKTPDLGGINNSIEAVLYCQKKGVGAYLGGTCNETDISARVCTHIAAATKPLQMLAKPGMGVDEGYMILFNEMQRILILTQDN